LHSWFRRRRSADVLLRTFLTAPFTVSDAAFDTLLAQVTTSCELAALLRHARGADLLVRVLHHSPVELTTEIAQVVATHPDTDMTVLAACPAVWWQNDAVLLDQVDARFALPVDDPRRAWAETATKMSMCETTIPDRVTRLVEEFEAYPEPARLVRAAAEQHLLDRASIETALVATVLDDDGVAIGERLLADGWAGTFADLVDVAALLAGTP
jgi:hypothetical protein